MKLTAKAPENRPNSKRKGFFTPTIHFQVRTASFRECKIMQELEDPYFSLTQKHQVEEMQAAGRVVEFPSAQQHAGELSVIRHCEDCAKITICHFSRQLIYSRRN